ncbi:hypothetical protein ASPZODRAFT_12305 [Penicilliopsis zonata CBS 506.65]|uniref:Seipin n=1 Tax=Penicilliopsis zonata CBS 506.65 TaxID=1073090 RepID=A0A1L9SWF0_9EURO|nr:hypothetical protein ASPZODRAFT_12305 [Penicilliopsis zonata CBS 506.65]OJJ51484.1 hypothetical protein ASPZODRAFT_12305 [Penicilliopsis zonata CBS 506.65]
MESDYSDDRESDEGPFARAADTLTSPMRVLGSKQALRAYLGTLLIVSASIILLGIATVAYWIFYFRFIPQISLERPVYLQFGDGHPRGTVVLDDVLVSQQVYDISVQLEMPRTPGNLAAGNFMLNLQLTTEGNIDPHEDIEFITAQRPAILTYASPLVDTARQLVQMPLYLLGWRREAETLLVPMLQAEFVRGRRNRPGRVHLELQSKRHMQIYSATVIFKARFSGLRRIMYNWRITAFVTFTTVFWSTSMVSASIAWLVLASFAGGKGNKTPTKLKNEAIKKEEEPEESDVSIKEESDEETEQFPIEREEEEEEEEEGGEGEEEDQTQPQQITTDTSADSDVDDPGVGTGTGLESAEARGIQRRRSHQARDGH